MLEIKLTSRFKKDLKKFNHHSFVINELDKVIKLLVRGKNLPAKYRNHSLSGDYRDSKECHLKPDVLLIYRIDQQTNLLYLERIGSHSELFE